MFDHKKRYSALDCLNHEFFIDIEDIKKEKEFDITHKNNLKIKKFKKPIFLETKKKSFINISDIKKPLESIEKS